MPAKRLIKEKDRKFRLLFKENPQPMWVFEAESQQFLEANDAASKLYGYSTDEFRGLKLTELEASREQSNGTDVVPSTPNPILWHHRTKSGRLIDVEAALH